MQSKILLNNYLEHTILKPDTTIQEVEQLCKDAIQYQFAGVCVPSYFLETAVELLQDTGIDIVTVIGFPYGYNSLMSKFEEAEDAINRGAHHLDMVINIAAVKNNPRMHIPIFGNGDIDSPEKAVEYKNKYGLDGIMIGRASIGYPWIFNEIIRCICSQQYSLSAIFRPYFIPDLGFCFHRIYLLL